MIEPITVSYISCSVLVIYLLVTTKLDWAKKRNEEGKISHYTIAMLAATLVQLLSFGIWLLQVIGG